MVDDSQLLTTASYIDLNPVRAKLCFRPEQWPWSSYRAHVGLEHPSRLLANAEFLKHSGPPRTWPEGLSAIRRREASCGARHRG